MAIRKIDGVYCISANQTWRPGCFESEHAARKGQRLANHEIEFLQELAGPGGVVTAEHIDILNRWKRTRSEAIIRSLRQ